MSTHVVEYEWLFKDYLEIRETATYGRGVYSKKNLIQGVEVIKSEPVAHVVDKKERGRRCDWCVTRNNDLRKCSRCKHVWYCGSTCQKADWPLHKVECKGMTRMSPHVPTDTARLLTRLLTRKAYGVPRPPPQCGRGWEISHMTSHAPRYSEELKESIATHVLGVKLLLGAELEFNGEETYDLASKVVCNTFHILDCEMLTVGTGVYLAPTFINHSCQPNCIAMFNGTSIRIRTIRNIKQDEQLFITYCELLDTCERRGKYLQRYHLFQCTCERCRDDKEDGALDKLMTSTTTSLSSTAQQKTLLSDGFVFLEECEKLRTSCEWGNLSAVISSYLADHAPTFGDMNIIVVKAREYLMDSHIELCQWDKAHRVAVQLEKAYKTLLPPSHPTLGLHYYKMAKLLNQCHNDTLSLQEAISLLQKSVAVLSVTHGSDHTLIAECKVLMSDLYSELSQTSNKDS